MPTTITAVPILSPFDRCDRCGATAKAKAILVGGGELLFCGHHARIHGPRLNELQAKLFLQLT
jgi:hypothetical protein